jgi:Zn-dependent alcohol dehydrogenase
VPGAAPVVREIEVAGPRPGEVRIRVEAVGVCHADLSWADGLFGGPFPGVAGHEIAGVVEAVGAGVNHLAAGDRVIATVIRHCGECARCAAGEPTLCERRDERPRRYSLGGAHVEQVFGTGGFAEATVLDASAVVVAPAEVPLEIAACVGCAVVTGYGAVRRLAHVESGADVAVIGCGGVGLAAVAAAAAAGAARVTAVDSDPRRLAEAVAFGATDSVARLDGLPPHDVVIEAAGGSAAARGAVALAGRGGTVVLVGLPAAGSELSVDHLDVVVGQKRILGCNMGNVVAEVDVPAIFELAASGRLPLERLATATYPLSEVAEAFSHARMRRGIRTIIRPDLYDKSGWQDASSWSAWG